MTNLSRDSLVKALKSNPHVRELDLGDEQLQKKLHNLQLNPD